jgi:hypothetical protein
MANRNIDAKGVCGGSNICKQAEECIWDCGASGVCEHGKRRSRCKECRERTHMSRAWQTEESVQDAEAATCRHSRAVQGAKHVEGNSFVVC